VSDADSNRSRVYLLQEEQIRKKILHMNADSILLTKLCECAQVLTPEEWQAWYAVYLQAASSLEDREARIAAVAEKLETNFELIGVTAIRGRAAGASTCCTLLSGTSMWFCCHVLHTITEAIIKAVYRARTVSEVSAEHVGAAPHAAR